MWGRNQTTAYVVFLLTALLAVAMLIADLPWLTLILGFNTGIWFSMYHDASRMIKYNYDKLEEYRDSKRASVNPRARP